MDVIYIIYIDYPYVMHVTCVWTLAISYKHNYVILILKSYTYLFISFALIIINISKINLILSFKTKK